MTVNSYVVTKNVGNVIGIRATPQLTTRSDPKHNRPAHTKKYGDKATRMSIMSLVRALWRKRNLINFIAHQRINCSKSTTETSKQSTRTTWIALLVCLYWLLWTSPHCLHLTLSRYLLADFLLQKLFWK